MVFWIKRTARILSIVTFFFVFFIGIDPAQPFDPFTLAIAFLKGLAGAALFWFAGFVLGDIVFKGLVAGVETTQADRIEGGLLQRLHDERERENPEAKKEKPPQAEKPAKKQKK